MKWVKRLLLLGVVFLLPLVVLAGAANLIARMPDFYQYEFERSNVSSELRLSVKNAYLAEIFSGFMWGKTEELVLMSEYMGTEEGENMILPDEQAAMGRFRTILNLFSLAGAVSLAAVVAAYYLLIGDGGKELVRRAFLASILLMLLYGGVFACGLLFSGSAEALKNFFMGGALPEEGLLVALFTKQFVIHGGMAAAAVAAIFYVIIGMITWSLTRPYRMFGPGRRDRI